MNQWAKDKKVDDLEDLAGPIAEAIQAAIQIGSDANKTGIPWNGPRLMSTMFRAVTPQPEAQLQPEQLKYHSSNNRNVFDVIAMIAIQLGIEQGMKIYEENYLEEEIIIRKAKENKS